VPCSLFLVPCSLFIVPCSLLFLVLGSWFLVPCSLFFDSCSLVLCPLLSVPCSLLLLVVPCSLSWFFVIGCLFLVLGSWLIVSGWVAPGQVGRAGSGWVAWGGSPQVGRDPPAGRPTRQNENENDKNKKNENANPRMLAGPQTNAHRDKITRCGAPTPHFNIGHIGGA